MATAQQPTASQTAEESFVIMAPPRMPDIAAEGRYPDRMEQDTDLEQQEGRLVSNTPSSAAAPPMSQIQLDEMLTIANTVRRENTELRNHLNELNLVVQHKSKSLEQIMRDHRQYDTFVKEKYQQTCVKFNDLKMENGRLADSNETLSDEKEKLEALLEATHRDQRAENTTSRESSENQTHEVDQLQTDLEQQLQRERQRCKEVNIDLNRTQDTQRKAENKLKTAFTDLAKLRDEKRRDLQELRGVMDREINNYKEQITTLLSELTENKRSLELHKRKVKELHEANQQFDEVNTAYHTKLSMYEEALKDKDAEMMKLRQDIGSYKGSVTEQMSSDRRQYDNIFAKWKKSTQDYDALQRRMDDQEHEKRSTADSQLARMVSMEESIEVRNSKLKKHEEDNQFLNEQLDQYRSDFESERSAREHLYQQNQSLNTQLKQCQKEKDRLQGQVDEYAQSQTMAFRNRFHSSSTSPEFNPPSPEYPAPTSPGFSSRFTPAPLPYGGQGRGYDVDEQHHQRELGRDRINRGRAEEELGEIAEHKCPMCHENFPETESLQIHVQEHF